MRAPRSVRCFGRISLLARPVCGDRVGIGDRCCASSCPIRAGWPASLCCSSAAPVFARRLASHRSTRPISAAAGNCLRLRSTANPSSRPRSRRRRSGETRLRRGPLRVPPGARNHQGERERALKRRCPASPDPLDRSTRPSRWRSWLAEGCPRDDRLSRGTAVTVASTLHSMRYSSGHGAHALRSPPGRRGSALGACGRVRLCAPGRASRVSRPARPPPRAS